MNCACGLPLHYADPQIEAVCRELVAERGEYVKITVNGQGSWMVQRHFIFLHGIKASDLPTSMMWEKVE